MRVQTRGSQARSTADITKATFSIDFLAYLGWADDGVEVQHLDRCSESTSRQQTFRLFPSDALTNDRTILRGIRIPLGRAFDRGHNWKESQLWVEYRQVHAVHFHAVH